MTYPLVHELLMANLQDEELKEFKKDPDSFIYVRRPGQEFWNGYRDSVKVCIYDDLFQENEAAM